jgi:hypothetical protein
LEEAFEPEKPTYMESFRAEKIVFGKMSEKINKLKD